MRPKGFSTLMSPPSWGGASLTETSELRTAYVNALQAADRGEIEPLLEFARS